jgi:hypothetical protein
MAPIMTQAIMLIWWKSNDSVRNIYQATRREQCSFDRKSPYRLSVLILDQNIKIMSWTGVMHSASQKFWDFIPFGILTFGILNGFPTGSVRWNTIEILKRILESL